MLRNLARPMNEGLLLIILIWICSDADVLILHLHHDGVYIGKIITPLYPLSLLNRKSTKKGK